MGNSSTSTDTTRMVWAYMAPASPANSVTWSQVGNSLNLRFNYSNTPQVIFKAITSNDCGVFVNYFAFKQSSCGTTTDPCANAKAFVISPNPTSGQIRITVDPNLLPPTTCPTAKAVYNSKEGFTFSQVNIYNNLGTLVLSQKTSKAKQATINLNGIVAGSYMVEIIEGDYVERQQIIVQ